MVAQTVQFETVSVSEIGSGTITAFLFSGSTLSATLGSIDEHGTLKGRHTGVVNDIAAGKYRLVVKFDGYTINESDEYVDLLLAVGTYVSYRASVLDSGTQTQIDKIEAVVAGTVTGAGTSTEVFVGPSATLTITVDASGNRSNVSVS